ncbi:MAG: pyridoxamine 5'-phosphate oxidase [Actinomycetes bacterium]
MELSSEPSSVDPSLLEPIVDAHTRVTYRGGPIPVDQAPPEPLEILRRWYAEAVDDPRIPEPNAMVVATVDPSGLPNARTVLLKVLDAEGFTFYTSLVSTKAAELATAPRAALVLLWHPMYRQVRVRGVVEQVSDEEAAAYFAHRPRDSQIGAWASQQSQPVAARADVERAFAEAEERWRTVPRIPKPPFWSGYRVRPVEIEFWVGQASRLHDRLAYTSLDGGPRRLDDRAAWTSSRLQP